MKHNDTLFGVELYYGNINPNENRNRKPLPYEKAVQTFSEIECKLTKELNPEKKGSVYDVKFVDKWEDSCDEAEKILIYKCAYKTYNKMSGLYIGLWIFCVFGNAIFDFDSDPDNADPAAAVAAGADGLMIEVHNDPAHALCDGAQSLTPDKFAAVAGTVSVIREAMV